MLILWPSRTLGMQVVFRHSWMFNTETSKIDKKKNQQHQQQPKPGKYAYKPDAALIHL